ncbi:MAG: hypothetical protein KGI06_03725 [Candidatus Micrarchaeota archaeon]|nr:hypothetical protein [Candidatus Micrarchaeota archaeon]
MSLYDKPHRLFGKHVAMPIAAHYTKKALGAVKGIAIAGSVWAGTELLAHGVDNLFNGISIRNNIGMESAYIAAGVGLTYIPKVVKDLWRGELKASELALGAVGIVGSGAAYNYMPSINSCINGILTAPNPLQHQMSLTNPEMGAALLTIGLITGVVWQGVTDIRSYSSRKREKSAT